MLIMSNQCDFGFQSPRIICQTATYDTFCQIRSQIHIYPVLPTYNALLHKPNPYNAEIFVCEPRRPKVFFVV